MGGDSGVIGVNIPTGQWHTFEVYELAIIFMSDGHGPPLQREHVESKLLTATLY